MLPARRLLYIEMGTVTSYELNTAAGVLFPNQEFLGGYTTRLAPALQHGLDENARSPKLNECRSTSESKQSVFRGFSTRNVWGELTRKDKGQLHCE